MKLRIDALDTLFFRNGKPFTSGEDVWANAQFPPLPSVLYGALHSAFLAELIRTWQKTPTTKTLTIKAMALQKEDDKLLFPAPLDYVKIKGRKKDTGKGLLLKERIEPELSNCPLNELLASTPETIVEGLEGCCLDSDALTAYLHNQEDKIRYTELSRYMKSEPKIGIGRDNATRTAQDQMLYCAEMQRLEGDMQKGRKLLSLFVEYEGIRLPKQGILRLGGEGKAAAYAPSNARLPAKPTLTGNRFKLYLASPAIFENGWRPAWLEPKKRNSQTVFEGTYRNLLLRLVTAIIGKPLFAGGFSVEHGRPKPMRKAVPAGSVYVFELRNGSTLHEAIEVFHGTTLADSAENQDLSDEQKQGFGLTFVGGAQ
jgi:CRISPR-associated protein Cmr3